MKIPPADFERLKDALARARSFVRYKPLGDDISLSEKWEMDRILKDAENTLQSLPAAPQDGVDLGDFTLMTSSTQGKVWIRRSCGEGGDFDKSALAAIVEKFYWENF